MDSLFYPVSDSYSNLTCLFCGHKFIAYYYATQETKIQDYFRPSSSGEGVVHLLYTSSTQMNEYVCRFCPPGARTYTQVLGAGCGNLGKHMKSQHEGDIEYWLKQHRGIELTGNTLDNNNQHVT